MKRSFLSCTRMLLSCWRSVGVGLLLAVVFCLFCYQFLQESASFNSDQLYCIQFCDDLLHGRDVQGFHMPAAPYLFPDMALVLVCRLLTSNIVATFFLYLFLYYTLLLLALMTICRVIGLFREESFTIAGLGVALLLACHFDPAYRGRGFLLSYPGNHMGCLLMGLAVTAFLARALRAGYHWATAALLVGTCAVSGFSDQLLIVQYLLPLCGAVLLLATCRHISLRHSLVTVGLLGLSSFLTMKMVNGAIRLGLVPMRIAHTSSLFQNHVLGAWQDFCDNWLSIIREQTLMKLVLLFHGMVAATVLIFWWRRKLAPSPQPLSPASGERGFQQRCLDRTAILLIALVFLLAPLSNATVLILMGSVEPFAVTRYLYTWWFLPWLCLMLWWRLLPGRLLRLIPAIGVLIVIFRVLTFPQPLSLAHCAPRYPPLAQALDEMARKYGPLRGFAEYWQTREMRYLTHEGMVVVPILNNGSPWFHGSNPNCFLYDDRHDLRIPDYHFVIFPANGDQVGPDPELITMRYGKPVEIIPTGEHIIWRYEHMKTRQLDLFLRAQIAQRLVRDKPYVAPSTPVALRTPKRNLTPTAARGNIALQRGQELAIRFDKPVTGAMIDVSANYCDAYTLLFFRDGRELGRTRVPAVSWTGAESAYCQPGLQSRLVAVPAACRCEGFNEAKLIPQGRSPNFVVGHFLVFDEWVPYQSGEDRQRERYHRYEGEKLHSPLSPEITMIPEASASDGHSRHATASYQGCIAYGPYTLLTPGRYRIDFTLKVADNRTSDVVASLDSCAFRGEQILQTRTLRGIDFSAANQYQSFALTFDTHDDLDFVEFRVFSAGKTSVTLDYVDVTRLDFQPTDEVCEP